MLALNAATRQRGRGNSGKGFAVVAEWGTEVSRRQPDSGQDVNWPVNVFRSSTDRKVGYPGGSAT